MPNFAVTFYCNEKETFCFRYPLHADAEAPAHAGVYIVPEAFHRRGPRVLDQSNCVAVLLELDPSGKNHLQI